MELGGVEMMMSKIIDPWNLAEVHLRQLPRYWVEVTYMGITRKIRSKQLWELIVDQRIKLAAIGWRDYIVGET